MSTARYIIAKTDNTATNWATESSATAAMLTECKGRLALLLEDAAA